MLRRDGAAGGLRAGLLLLVVLGVVGSALALAYERHWQSAWQLAPWLTLGIISAACVALVVRQTAATVWLARAVAVLAIVSAALGVWQHVDANLDADPAAGHHAAGQQATAAASRDSDDEGKTASADHHADDEEKTVSADHHGSDDEGKVASADHHGSDDEEKTASADHHSDDKAKTASDDGSDDEEKASAGASLVDALTGSAGHAPVPAALALAPVGLALALATIGLGGSRGPSQG